MEILAFASMTVDAKEISAFASMTVDAKEIPAFTGMTGAEVIPAAIFFSVIPAEAKRRAGI